jgi:hypothetical protein
VGINVPLEASSGCEFIVAHESQHQTRRSLDGTCLGGKHHIRASDASFCNEMADVEYRSGRTFDKSEGVRFGGWRRQDFPNGDKIT